MQILMSRARCRDLCTAISNLNEILMVLCHAERLLFGGEQRQREREQGRRVAAERVVAVPERWARCATPRTLTSLHHDALSLVSTDLKICASCQCFAL